MSFWENHKDLSAGGEWVSGDERSQLIEQGVPFTITSIQEDPTNQYGPRYVLFCTIPNLDTGEPEDRKVGFNMSTPDKPIVPSRDVTLAAMKEYLEKGGEPVEVKLTKPKRSILVVPSE